MRQISEIIIHCSATRPEWMSANKTSEKVAEIRRWHMDKGWRDIGYHYLIDRDGTVATGRPVEQTGAHVKGHNTGTIGLCLIGGHGSDKTDQFDDHYTPEQDKALDRLLSNLTGRFGAVPVTGHNQYANKACPGFIVGARHIDAPEAPPAVEVPPQGLFAKLVGIIATIFGRNAA